MTPGEILTRWTIRIALAFYAVAMTGWLWGGQRRRWQWLAGCAWTAGCLLYLGHVASAFHFYHGWSHAAAYRETARQTAELFGWHWGGGLYFNYAFTLAWVADVVRWWQGGTRYPRRARVLGAALHVFMAFMVFNATVVFETGPMRWLGLLAALGLVVLWRRTPHSTESLLTSTRQNLPLHPYS